jgi:purine nucleosidase
LKRLLIDTDTASDDAVALVLALKHPDAQIEAITVVAGNMPLAQGVQNALYTVELCEKDVPVYAGASLPLLKPLVTAEDFHGSDGLGDIGLPLTGRVAAEGRAADVIVDTINRYPGEVTLVALAPLTNLALALRLDPSIAAKVQRCVIMGGTAQGPGNVTPVAEYNIWVDPEAAQIVFSSSLPITLVDWYVTRTCATISPAEMRVLQAIGTPLARFCCAIQRAHLAFNQTVGIEGPVFADPLAMAIALEPALAEETKRAFIAVETRSLLCLGQTVVDYTGIPNAEVVLSASHELFLALLHRALA